MGGLQIYSVAIIVTYLVIFHPIFNPPWQYFITSRWQEKVEFWPTFSIRFYKHLLSPLNTCIKIMDVYCREQWTLEICFGGIYRIYLKLLKKHRKVTTCCNWLDLETLGFWSIMPINFLGQWWGGRSRESNGTVWSFALNPKPESWANMTMLH